MNEAVLPLLTIVALLVTVPTSGLADDDPDIAELTKKAEAGDAEAMEWLRVVMVRFPAEAGLVFWSAGLGVVPYRLEDNASGDGWDAMRARRCLGRVSDAQALVAAGEAPNEATRREWQCEAHGLLGLLAERAGDRDLAVAQYWACVAVGQRNWLQHVWAECRLRALAGEGD